MHKGAKDFKNFLTHLFLLDFGIIQKKYLRYVVVFRKIFTHFHFFVFGPSNFSSWTCAQNVFRDTLRTGENPILSQLKFMRSAMAQVK